MKYTKDRRDRQQKRLIDWRNAKRIIRNLIKKSKNSNSMKST